MRQADDGEVREETGREAETSRPMLIRKSLFSLFRRFRGLFLGARATELVEHRVVGFVAGVFEKLIALFLRDGERELPRLREDLRVVDSQFVLHCIQVGACKTFDQTKSVTRGNAVAVPSDTRLVVEEIRGLDDERVSFPVPA